MLKDRLWFSFKLKVFGLVMASIIAVSFAIYCCIDHSISVLKDVLNHRVNAIESSVDIYFGDMNSLMHNLSTSLVPKLLTNDGRAIKDILYNLKSDPKHHMSTPTLGIVLLDGNGDAIANTLSRSKIYSNIKIKNHPECFIDDNKEPFNINIHPIRVDYYLQENVVPIIVGIQDDSHKRIGVICIGVIVKQLNEYFTVHYGETKYLNHITITNKVGGALGHGDVDDIDVSFVISSLFKKEDVVLHRFLKRHPFMLNVEVKYKYFEDMMRGGLVLSFWLLSAPLIMFSLIFYFIRKHIKSIMRPLHNKLRILNESFMGEADDGFVMESVNEKFNISNFIGDFNKLIEDYYLLKIGSIKQQESIVKRKIIDLVLTEKHFLVEKRDAVVDEDRLYINKLLNMIDEDSANMPLYVFLRLVADYCCEFYHEFVINVVVPDKGRPIVFKKSALIETIFHIFTFIVRSNCAADNAELILSGDFVEGDDFPVITIEAGISHGEVSALGWESGPSYVYTSLLSIFLLAQKNGLFFNIIKNKNKILFVLEPANKKIDFYSKVLEE